MRRRIPTLAVFALALAASPRVTSAQVIQPLAVRPARHLLGAAGVYGQPIGEFGQNVRRAFGIDGFGVMGIDARGIFGFRGEVAYQQYGSKSERFFVGSGFGELESETKSGVLTFGVGPQFTAPEGPLRPYVAGTVGFARFATQTSISIPAEESNTGEKQTIDSQDISSDFILSLTGSAGLLIRLGGSGALLDLGARYHHNGRAEYVTPDDIEYDGTGQPIVRSTQSEASFVVYRIGIAVPIR